MTVLWFLSQSGVINLPAMLGTKNNGVLISPVRAVADLNLRDSNGYAIEFSQSPVWTLIIPGRRHCDATCQETLYFTRQTHIAMGREANLFRRFYLSLDGEVDAAYTELQQRDHPNLLTVFATGEDLSALLNGLGIEDPLSGRYLFLVDPQGWLMMYYTDQHTGKDIIKDIKALLSVASH